MKTDYAQRAIGIILCLVLSGTGIFYVMNAIDQQMKENARQQMNSNSYGPLDNELADIAGVARRPKPDYGLPESVEFDLTFD